MKFEALQKDRLYHTKAQKERRNFNNKWNWHTIKRRHGRGNEGKVLITSSWKDTRRNNWTNDKVSHSNKERERNHLRKFNKFPIRSKLYESK